MNIHVLTKPKQCLQNWILQQNKWRAQENKNQGSPKCH